MKTYIKMQFDPKLAKELGVEEAIMYANLEFWVKKNKANKKHYHDNHYWTYNTLKAFQELFTFWTTRQINRILKNLEKSGYIKVGNYNKAKYDRTKWYTCISPNGKMEDTKRENGIDRTVKPIPNNKPNSKPNNTMCAQAQSSEDILKKIMGNNINEVISAFWEEDKNLSGGAGFGRKVYRDAAEFLIKKHGLKNVLDLVKLALAVRGQQYAPVITNPVELRDKLVKLKAYIEKENSKKPKILWGTDFSKT